MFILRIPTEHRPNFDDDAGRELARILRDAANAVEDRISIVPRGPGEWVPEHYRTNEYSYTLREAWEPS